MKETAAEIIQEYGPFSEGGRVNGVSYDGDVVWWAAGEKLNAMDPDNGEILRYLEVASQAGTAFDGEYLYQIADGRILKIAPDSGEVVGSISAPSADGNTGMAWADGSLWVGQGDGHSIHQIDPESGEVLRVIESNRFVTGVTWVEGELWHATWDDDDKSELRQIDPETGELLQQLNMPEGVGVSGLESDGGERFFCGGGGSGRIRVVRRPKG